MHDGVIGAVDEKPNWTIQPETFLEHLLAKWSDINYSILKNIKVQGDFRVTFVIKVGVDNYGEVIVNGLFDGTNIYVDGDIEYFPELALWYRKLVPSEYKLFFGLGDFNATAIEVDENTTIEILSKKLSL
jgi:hypothetical protein